MISSYLSVDLDFWANKFSETQNKKQAKRFLIKLRNLDKKIFFHLYHDEILNDLNKQYNRLYQIDYHSDIVCEPVLDNELNEGTWANFYSHRENCIFDWRYPSEKECFDEGWGRCEWTSTEARPEDWKPDEMGYKRVIRSDNLYHINWESISSVGVCMSPNWCSSWIYQLCKEVFGNKKIFRQAIKEEENWELTTI